MLSGFTELTRVYQSKICKVKGYDTCELSFSPAAIRVILKIAAWMLCNVEHNEESVAACLRREILSWVWELKHIISTSISLLRYFVWFWLLEHQNRNTIPVILKWKVKLQSPGRMLISEEIIVLGTNTNIVRIHQYFLWFFFYFFNRLVSKWYKKKHKFRLFLISNFGIYSPILGFTAAFNTAGLSKEVPIGLSIIFKYIKTSPASMLKS